MIMKKELFLKRWSIVFWNDNEKIGELKFTNEGLKFTGKTNECAKNFFDVYLKEITNDYMKSKE